MSARQSYLFNPWLDFLGLGGASLIVLALFFLLYPDGELARSILAASMLFLAHFVNHPHFAHSYQLFYSGFREKAFSHSSALGAQYRIAGILVPAALAAFFAFAISAGSAPLIGLAANAMFFTVGWHYAKQGYGILMLDAVQKGKPFGAAEKRHLLWNVHLAWPTYWLMTNDVLAAKNYWGLTYYVFDTPDAILLVMFAATALSGTVVLRDLYLKWRAEGTLPVNGLVAFVVSIYVWLYLARFDPILLLIVPFFHSLQYLCVVWRYQANLEAETLRSPPSPENPGAQPAWTRTLLARLLRFVLIGGLLGGIGFWIAPHILDSVVAMTAPSSGRRCSFSWDGPSSTFTTTLSTRLSGGGRMPRPGASCWVFSLRPPVRYRENYVLGRNVRHYIAKCTAIDRTKKLPKNQYCQVV